MCWSHLTSFSDTVHMLKTQPTASRFFLLSLTLGIATATVWNTIAFPALSGTQLPLPEILETMISEALTSILGVFLVVLTLKQLVPSGRWKWFWFTGKLALLGACLFAGLAVVWLGDSSILPIRFNLFLALFTDLAFWNHGFSLPLQLLNWSWHGILLMVLLATSTFLFLLLTGKAVRKGQFHWPILTICGALVFTSVANNLETLAGNAFLSVPPSFLSFPTLFWNIAPFLGVSVLWLAMQTDEAGPLRLRRSWWTSAGTALVLSLDLSVIVVESASLLSPADAPGGAMPFWLLPPLLAIGALAVALGLALVALARSKHILRGGRRR